MDRIFQKVGMYNNCCRVQMVFDDIFAQTHRFCSCFRFCSSSLLHWCLLWEEIRSRIRIVMCIRAHTRYYTTDSTKHRRVRTTTTKMWKMKIILTIMLCNTVMVILIFVFSTELLFLCCCCCCCWNILFLHERKNNIFNIYNALKTHAY